MFLRRKKTLRCLDDSLATNAVSRNRSPAVDLEPRSAPIGNPVASGNHKWHGNESKCKTHLRLQIDSSNFSTITGWWLTYPSEKYESQLGLLFPIWKNKKCSKPGLFETMVACVPWRPRRLCCVTGINFSYSANSEQQEPTKSIQITKKKKVVSSCCCWATWIGIPFLGWAHSRLPKTGRGRGPRICAPWAGWIIEKSPSFGSQNKQTRFWSE